MQQQYGTGIQRRTAIQAVGMPLRAGLRLLSINRCVVGICVWLRC